MKWWHNLLWGLAGAYALDSFRPDAAKALVPLVGPMPTIVRGKPGGFSLMSFVDKYLPKIEI